MTRNDLYAEVKKYNLQKTILHEYGKNFTNVPSFVLADYIAIAKKDAAKTAAKCVNKVTQKDNCDKLKNAFVALVSQLKCYRILSDSHAANILNML